MILGQLKQVRSHIFMTGLLAAAISISACQKQEPESDLNDSVNAEESVPMSAEPAEPSDIVILDDNDDEIDDENDVLNETESTESTESEVGAEDELTDATSMDVESDVVVDADTETDAAQ